MQSTIANPYNQNPTQQFCFSPYATNIIVIEFCRPQKLKLNVTDCYAKYTVT